MRTLVAGLGNIFHGDDGVGVAVAEALTKRELPEGALARDFGIRGVHLAYELLDGYDLLVIIDAVSRGGKPGTVHVIEHAPGVAIEPGGAIEGEILMDAHDMAPDEVLALVPTLGGSLGRVVVVGCEIETLDPGMGLSEAVQGCVEEAVETVLGILKDAYALDEEHRIETGIGGGR